jgi:phage tail protein X
MRRVITRDGDMLDAICKAELGAEAHAATVLDLNPRLADLGPVYAAGVAIVLPDAAAPAAKPAIRLWGAA